MTVPEYPIELNAPNITNHRQGNIGLDYVWQFDSGVPGPHVMINAVTHGNELCGAITVDWLLRERVRPIRGVLTLCFANTAAFFRFDPNNPRASRFVDEDFNRLWTAEVLDGPRDSIELRRARDLRPLIDTVELLFDIHSMQHRSPPLMMAGPLAKGRHLASAVGVPVHVVSDEGHAAGRRLRDYAGFGDPASPKNALLVECGQHWAQDSARLASESTLRFLKHTGIVDPEFVTRNLNQFAKPGRIDAQDLPVQRFIEVTEAVTIETDAFTFVQPFTGLEVIPRAGDPIGYDGDRTITAPYDDCVLVMPTQRLRAGQTAVRLGRFIEPPHETVGV